MAKLQNRLLASQVGIKDQRDELLEENNITNEQCKERHDNLPNESQELEVKHGVEQTKLAGEKTEEKTAAEKAELKRTELEQFKSHMLQYRKSGSTKLKTIESEKCGVMKICGEPKKLQGDQQPFLQDFHLAIDRRARNSCTKSCTLSLPLKLSRSFPATCNTHCPHHAERGREAKDWAC